MKGNDIEIEGHKVRIKKENLEEIKDISFINASPIIKEECPLLAEGQWTSDGQWLFFRTHPDSDNYNLDFEDFVEVANEAKEEVKFQ